MTLSGIRTDHHDYVGLENGIEMLTRSPGTHSGGQPELGWRVTNACAVIDIVIAHPEFEPFLDQCRFGSDCSHTHEPRCAVREAAESGDIARPRYASYVSLMEESKQER
jgi:ribosome biogenesis GTPase